MSAARAAARLKPVVVVKSGRMAQGAKAAATHTGALAGSDAVYDAAFPAGRAVTRRSTCASCSMRQLLARHSSASDGNRLAILTNGGGLGILAVDRLGGAWRELRQLSRPKSTAKLDAALPTTWSKANPVDISGDADAKRDISPRWMFCSTTLPAMLY